VSVYCPHQGFIMGIVEECRWPIVQCGLRAEHRLQREIDGVEHGKHGIRSTGRGN
jgi:hypothetical protein